MRKLKLMIIAAAVVLACPLLLAAQQSTVVDVPMLFRGTTPAVEVMVNGKGKFLFAIDTGAQGMARADSSLVERLGLQTIGQATGSDTSGRNGQAMNVVQIDSISIGELQFRNLQAPSRNYNQSTSLPHIDGILGFNLFSEYLVTLDFPAKRVRIERGELPKPDGLKILNFESSRGIPTVELKVGNLVVKADIDSGNTIGGFVLPSSIVEKLSFASQPITVGRARTVSNDVEIKQAQLKESLRLGGYEFIEPTIIFPAVSEYANVGSKVLTEFVITFDQKNKRMRLDKRETSKAAEQVATSQPSDFKEYAGRYGERTILFEGGALYIQRQGGPKLKLASASKDEFTLEAVPGARIKFVRDKDGKITELDVLNRAGEWEKSQREQP